MHIKQVQMDLIFTSANQLCQAEQRIKQILNRDILPRLGVFLSGLPDNAAPLHIPKLELSLGDFTLAEFSAAFLRAFEKAWLQHLDAAQPEPLLQAIEQAQTEINPEDVEALPLEQYYLSELLAMLENGKSAQQFTAGLLAEFARQPQYWRHYFFQLISKSETRNQLINSLHDDALSFILTLLSAYTYTELSERYPAIAAASNALSMTARLTHWHALLDPLAADSAVTQPAAHTVAESEQRADALQHPEPVQLQENTDSGAEHFIPEHYLEQWQTWHKQVRQLLQILLLLPQDKEASSQQLERFLYIWQHLAEVLQGAEQTAHKSAITAELAAIKSKIAPHTLGDLHRYVSRYVSGCLRRNQPQIEFLQAWSRSKTNAGIKRSNTIAGHNLNENTKPVQSTKQTAKSHSAKSPDSPRLLPAGPLQSLQAYLQRIETVLLHLVTRSSQTDSAALAALLYQAGTGAGEYAELRQVVSGVNSLTRLQGATHSPEQSSVATGSSLTPSTDMPALSTARSMVNTLHKGLPTDAVITPQAQQIPQDSTLIQSVKPAQATNQGPDQASMVNNAGLVIIAPFINQLFTSLHWITEQGFTTPVLQQRAALLLEYLVTGSSDFSASDLTLNKVLCGIDDNNTPLALTLSLSESELELCETLLNAVIAHWHNPLLTDAQQLRQFYLQRRGELRQLPQRWLLQPQVQPQDQYLPQLPWTLDHIKLPWMPNLLAINWRE